jgi:ubiquinone/menaquinone biosynthesis C-methylase UbiE
LLHLCWWAKINLSRAGGKLSFGDASFDTVFVIWSKADNLTDQWVSEINRVLKSSAQVLLQVPLLDNQVKVYLCDLI